MKRITTWSTLPGTGVAARSGEGFVDGPVVEAELQRCGADADFEGPLGEIHGAAGELDDANAFAVGELLLAGGPSHVAGIVSLRAVDAVEGHAGRTLTHVGKKVLKGTPALANRDACRSVTPVGRVGRTCASVNHGAPRAICRRGFTTSACMPVFSTYGDNRRCGSFSTEAPARAREATAKALLLDHFLSSAIASAQPLSLTAFTLGARPFGKHSESSESFINHSHILLERTQCVALALSNAEVGPHEKERERSRTNAALHTAAMTDRNSLQCNK